MRGAAACPARSASYDYLPLNGTPSTRTDPDPGMFALNEQVVCRRRAADTIDWNWNVGLASPPLPPGAVGCG